jgi:hypothetical protein
VGYNLINGEAYATKENETQKSTEQVPISDAPADKEPDQANTQATAQKVRSI